MTLVLIGLGAVALALPGLRSSISLRGDPRWFAPLDAAALTLGLASIVTGLGLSAVVGVLSVLAGTSLARYEGHLAPGGIVVWVVSGVVLVALAGRLAAFGRRARHGRRLAYADRWLGHHQDLGDHELVVLPTEAPVAYSVEGSPPQIVISQGLRAHLGSDLVDFVVDHERAHLRRKHRRALLVAAFTDAMFGRIPAISRSTLTLRLTVERAADEEAAGVDPHRRRRVGSALRALGSAHLPKGCGADAVHYRAGLLTAIPAPHAVSLQLVAAAALAVIAVAAAAVTGHAGGDLPTLLATVR